MNRSLLNPSRWSKKTFLSGGCVQVWCHWRNAARFGQLCSGNYFGFSRSRWWKCTFQEYLRSRGLFASKCHVYLMSTQDDMEESSPCNLNQTEDSGLVSYCLQDKAERPSTSQLGVFMGCSKTEMSEEFQSLEMKTSTPMRNSSRSQSPLYAPAIKGAKELVYCRKCRWPSSIYNLWICHRIIFFGSPSHHGFVFKGRVLWF